MRQAMSVGLGFSLDRGVEWMRMQWGTWFGIRFRFRFHVQVIAVTKELEVASVSPPAPPMCPAVARRTSPFLD